MIQTKHTKAYIQCTTGSRKFFGNLDISTVMWNLRQQERVALELPTAWIDSNRVRMSNSKIW